jgi:divalent metal cation (Fe/Co/Zn/Cd) transporter
MKPGMLPRGTAVELALLLALLVVALGSGSVTLLGETLRSALIAAAGIWAALALAKAARDGGRRYEFGLDKLEQAGHTAIAVALAVAGLWVAGRAFALLVVGASAATPLGFALAATAHAVHGLRRGILLGAQPPLSPPCLPSPAGLARLLPLLVVQIALTVAALAQDPALALAADCAGGIFLGLLMTVAGARIVWETVPDLIDHPLRRQDEAALARLLVEQGVRPQELIGLRSRRSGRHLFVELTVNPADDGSLDDTCGRLARLRASLEARLGGLDLSIRLHPPPG